MGSYFARLESMAEKELPQFYVAAIVESILYLIVLQ
jgi:hypothetical protein